MYGRLALSLFLGFALPAGLAAQDVVPDPPPLRSEERTAGVWVFAGVTTALSKQWRATFIGGHLGGLGTSFAYAQTTFAARADTTLTLGYGYALREGRTDWRGIHIVRGGGAWIFLRRGPFEVDNTTFVEYFAIEAVDDLVRFRDRVRVTWQTPGDRLRLRLFGSAELFISDAFGVAGHRYNAGVGRTFGRATVDIYWLRRYVRDRLTFDAAVVQLVWRADRS